MNRKFYTIIFIITLKLVFTLKANAQNCNYYIGDTLIISDAGINLRNNPDLNSKIVKKSVNAQEFIVLNGKKTNGFVNVRTEHLDSVWVHSDFLNYRWSFATYIPSCDGAEFLMNKIAEERKYKELNSCRFRPQSLIMYLDRLQKCYFNENEFEKAIITISQILEFDKKLLNDLVRKDDLSSIVDLYNRRGGCKIELNDLMGAISDLSYSIRIDSKNYEAYFLRGYAKAILEDYREGMADLTKAIELNSKSEDAYYNRGIMKVKVGDKRGGCLDLSRSGELGHPQAYSAINHFCN